IGMKSTTLDIKEATKHEHASPHSIDYKMTTAVIPIAYEGGPLSVGPAGALWSNVRDMSRYLLVELGKGKTPEGKQVVSEGAMMKRRERQVKIGEKSAYGLGLEVAKGHDVPSIGHNGATLGFTSDAFFMPDHGLGMVVLSNARTGTALNGAIRRRLMELLFG